MPDLTLQHFLGVLERDCVGCSLRKCQGRVHFLAETLAPLVMYCSEAFFRPAPNAVKKLSNEADVTEPDGDGERERDRLETETERKREREREREREKERERERERKQMSLVTKLYYITVRSISHPLTLEDWAMLWLHLIVSFGPANGKWDEGKDNIRPSWRHIFFLV